MIFKHIALAVLGFAMIQLPAEAADSQRGPCRADIQKLCPDAIQAQEIGRCLAEHESELSAACQERVTKLRARHQELAAACKSDVANLCKDTQRGRDRIQCLKEHESELSPECKAAFTSALEPKQ
jgi:Skp family chaperone for outer membrane proteins